MMVEGKDTELGFEDDGGRGRHRLTDGAREEGTVSSDRDP
jgi:hypothetical protein